MSSASSVSSSRYWAFHLDLCRELPSPARRRFEAHLGQVDLHLSFEDGEIPDGAGKDGEVAQDESELRRDDDFHLASLDAEPAEHFQLEARDVGILVRARLDAADLGQLESDLRMVAGVEEGLAPQRGVDVRLLHWSRTT